MKRSLQEVVELVFFGLAVLVIGTGLIWLVGWVFSVVGLALKWFGGLLWVLLKFIVPIVIVAGLIYFLVKALQGRSGPKVAAAAAGASAEPASSSESASSSAEPDTAPSAEPADTAEAAGDAQAADGGAVAHANEQVEQPAAQDEEHTEQQAEQNTEQPAERHTEQHTEQAEQQPDQPASDDHGGENEHHE